MFSCIDRPTAGALCDPLSLAVEGWFFADERHPSLDAIEARVAGELVGETRVFFERLDVSRTLHLPLETRTGFAVLACFKARSPPTNINLEFHARFRDGVRLHFANRTVGLIERDYRVGPHGNLLDSEDSSRLRHRDYIFSTGRPSAGGSQECLSLLRRYLGRPPCRVLDVGCGLGFYGRHLLEGGYAWFGVEVRESDCAELARQGLPHRRVDGRTLPFADRSFDAAVCIEVLEHIDDLARFLLEIRRVAPRLLVSVPNIELLPYMYPRLAAPWHVLEGDHKNFFTRWSLRALLRRFYDTVEVLGYGETPLKTVEGLWLDYHLFAVATAPVEPSLETRISL